MSIRLIRAAGGGGARTLIDLREFDGTGIMDGGLDTVASMVSGAKLQNNERYFGATVSGGAGGNFETAAFFGGFARRISAPNAGLFGCYAPTWSVPFWRDITQFPPTYQPARRFIVAATMLRVGVPIDSIAHFGVCRQPDILNGGGAGGGQCGVEVLSSPGVNGGRWSVGYQLFPIGPITYVDSGIAAAAVVRAEIDHNEFTQTLIVRINGKAVVTLVGVANLPRPFVVMPAQITNNSVQMMASLVSRGTTNVPGQFDYYWDLRYRQLLLADGDGV